jgi:hypothetical protein
LAGEVPDILTRFKFGTLGHPDEIRPTTSRIQ